MKRWQILKFYSVDGGGDGGGGGGVAAPSDGGGAAAPADTPQNSPLYEEFVSQIPKEQLPLIQPHLDKFGPKLNEIHQQLDQYSMYEGVDPEQAQQAFELYNYFLESPQEVYEALRQQYGDEIADEVTDQMQQQSDQDQGQQTDPQYQQLQQQLQQQQQMVEQMAQIMIQQQQSQQQQQEDSELETYLDSLKQQHGEFDEEYVLLKMSQGMDGDKAVQAYQKLAKSNAMPQTSPTLSGGGVIPQESLDVTKLQSKDVKNLVASALQRSLAQGQ